MKCPIFSPAILACILVFPVAPVPARAIDLILAPLPTTKFRVRVETRLQRERDELLESIGHYALVYRPSQRDLHRFMAQIYPRQEGPDIVMAAAGGIELHGGGVLELIAKLWQPNGRLAELDDVFPFRAGSRAVALREIYDSHRRQIFLPESIQGTPLPTGSLPRTRMHYVSGGKSASAELDAYNVLALLLRYEPDLERTWTNRMGQRISAALLLDTSWNHYVVPRSAEEEFSDHSYLHLVELLLAYSDHSTAKGRRDPNELKRRLLSVELKRETFGGYEDSEALSHYVDSLGFLVADPDVSWTESEKTQVRIWLHELETVRLVEIDSVPLQHLTHLLRGLRQIAEHAERLQ